MGCNASKRNINHCTEIDVPIEFAWRHLLAINTWEQWSKWTTLKAEGDVAPQVGVRGRLNASVDGDDNHSYYDFVFGEIDEKTHTFRWNGDVAGGCLFSGRHHIRFEAISDSRIMMEHAESFGGILPSLGLGLPYDKLTRNYLLMNESFKSYIEKKYQEK